MIPETSLKKYLIESGRNSIIFFPTLCQSNHGINDDKYSKWGKGNLSRRSAKCDICDAGSSAPKVFFL